MRFDVDFWTTVTIMMTEFQSSGWIPQIHTLIRKVGGYTLQLGWMPYYLFPLDCLLRSTTRLSWEISFHDFTMYWPTGIIYLCLECQSAKDYNYNYTSTDWSILSIAKVVLSPILLRDRKSSWWKWEDDLGWYWMDDLWRKENPKERLSSRLSYM
jgi:hypothetical protein